MNQPFFRLAAMLALVVSIVSPAIGQEIVAEVETWRGDTWRIAQPSVDVFYTIIPTPVVDQSGAPPPGQLTPGGAGPMGGMPVGSGPIPTITGSVRSLSAVFGRGPEPLRAQRPRPTLTLMLDGAEITVPYERIASLVVRRQNVTASPLPLYVAPTHIRYSATAVLSDGSMLEADYVNFGTAVLRGMGPHGRVEIPFEDVRVFKIK